MLDNAVKIAKDFAAKHGDTLIVVVPDHGHPVSIIGTYDDAAGTTLRERLQTYAEAKFPNYPPPDAEGYPPSIDVSRRLALVFCRLSRLLRRRQTLPQRREHADGTGSGRQDIRRQRGLLRARFRPQNWQPGHNGKARRALCRRRAAHRSGPGAELFHGHLDNTDVFRVMATALALGR